MKIHILYNIHKGSLGGGNQFLKALKKQFLLSNIFTDEFSEANIILFDSYQNLVRAVYLKYKYTDKIFVHRLGPIFHTYRGKNWKIMDNLMAEVANNVADVVIPQSNWTYQNFLKLGLKKEKKFNIINNTVDGEIFNTKYRSEIRNKEKIRLVADSWSPNWNKGFKFYQYLDENLDFNKFEMTFVGNSPIKFKNIVHIPPLQSFELSRELQKHDIFISGVKDDACSNSIIEALACGLPVVALKSGGNMELVKRAGEIYEKNEDLIDKIGKVSENIEMYQSLIKIDDIENVAKDYIDSIKIDFSEKKISFFYFVKFSIHITLFRLLDKIISIYKKYVK